MARRELAIRLIKELGAKQMQKDANVARCTISSWKIRGIPRAWIKFFQEKYPELEVWQEIKA